MHIGKNIFQINNIDIDQRKFIKDLCFLIIYGGTKHGFAKKYDCSLEIADKLINKFFQLFPKVEEWILKTQIEILENKFVESCFGRIRSLDQNEDSFIDETILRQGQNFKVQSAANDITIAALNEISENILKESKIVFHVHDSIGILSPLNQSEYNTQMISNIMKKPKQIKNFGLENINLNPIIEFLKSWR
jgi:DNA polymerase-1